MAISAQAQQLDAEAVQPGHAGIPDRGRDPADLLGVLPATDRADVSFTGLGRMV
jgi:hypothetical protein